MFASEVSDAVRAGKVYILWQESFIEDFYPGMKDLEDKYLELNKSNTEEIVHALKESDKIGLG